LYLIDRQGRKREREKNRKEATKYAGESEGVGDRKIEVS
jgi:hypothetical protein